jgi:hypothetical protein
MHFGIVVQLWALPIIPSCELQLRWLVLIEQNHLNTNVLSAICHTAPTKAHIVVIASKAFVLVPQNAELNRVFLQSREVYFRFRI